MKKIFARGMLGILTLGTGIRGIGFAAATATTTAPGSAAWRPISRRRIPTWKRRNGRFRKLAPKWLHIARYSGLSFSNYVSSLDAEEMRAADGSALTIGFSNDHAARPDIVLNPAAGDPPPQLGDWRG